MKKAPAMPSLGAFFGLGTAAKKALSVKKTSCKSCTTKKPVAKKKKQYGPKQ